MSRSPHAKNTARKNENAKRAGELRASGLTYRDIAAELGVGVGTVSRLLGESKAMALAEMTEWGHVIRDQEDARLLEIIESGWAMVQDIAGQTDKGVPVSYKAAAALTTVLRASESRRKLWGVDAPTRIEATTTRVELPSDEEAAARLADLPPE